MEEYVGPHNPHEVLVLADSGYYDKRIEKAITKRDWAYVIALKKKRSVRSEKTHEKTTLSKGWHQVELFFKNHRPGWPPQNPPPVATSKSPTREGGQCRILTVVMERFSATER